MKKAVQNYLNKTPHADLFDVMLVFPELTMDDADQAVRRYRFMRVVRRFLLGVVVTVAIIVIMLLRR